MDKKELTGKFKAIGAGFAVDPRNSAVTLSLLDEGRALQAREVFYAALNGLEPFFTVFIKGAPFCFMPDAWDHILYAGKAGAGHARIPACAACALKALCPGLKKNGVFFKSLRGELKPVLAAPREVVFELTKDCNLNCGVCFAGKTAGEQPLKKLKELLAEARALGVKDIRFTGGEPFLSPNLLPMLKAAKAAGFYTLVNTNASVPGSGLLEKAAPLIDNVLVSLQGHDAGSESLATGVKGLFPLKLANMRRLRSKVRVFRLGTVASRDVLNNFTAYRALAVKLKADVWEIYRPMLDKRNAAAGGEFDLKPADMKRLSAVIAALKPGGPRTLLANPLPLCLVPAAERKHLLGAAFDDGHTRLVHDPRGFFKPSYYIAERLGEGIKEAWGSAYMRTLRSFAWLPSRCRPCVHLLKCLGGSRFLAKTAAGNYFAADPWMPGPKASPIK